MSTLFDNITKLCEEDAEFLQYVPEKLKPTFTNSLQVVCGLDYDVITEELSNAFDVPRLTAIVSHFADIIFPEYLVLVELCSHNLV